MFGKTLFLKFGNWLRIVPIDTVLPDNDMAEKCENYALQPDNNKTDLKCRMEDVPVSDLIKDMKIFVNVLFLPILQKSFCTSPGIYLADKHTPYSGESNQGVQISWKG